MSFRARSSSRNEALGKKITESLDDSGAGRFSKGVFSCEEILLAVSLWGSVFSVVRGLLSEGFWGLLLQLQSPKVMDNM